MTPVLRNTHISLKVMSVKMSRGVSSFVAQSSLLHECLCGEGQNEGVCVMSTFALSTHTF